ncbi:MAG: prepilin peptidase [Acidobacteria bacterium]|nr:prepilin peptidase [Acidobacteriota bacterium]
MNAFPIAVAVFLGIAACITDLRDRTVPNWIPVAALLAGLGYHMVAGGWRGFALSAGGAACGFAVFLPLYLLGGMGGGDVKLTAGFGALLGLPDLWQAVLWMCLAGGIAAAVVVYWRLFTPRVPGRTGKKLDCDAIPYAPAIAAGAWMALWVRS